MLRIFGLWAVYVKFGRIRQSQSIPAPKTNNHVSMPGIFTTLGDDNLTHAVFFI